MTGKEFKNYRIKLGLTQIQLADTMAVPQGRISEWESGARSVPPYIEKLILCLMDKNN